MMLFFVSKQHPVLPFFVSPSPTPLTLLSPTLHLCQGVELREAYEIQQDADVPRPQPQPDRQPGEILKTSTSGIEDAQYDEGDVNQHFPDSMT